MPRAGKQKGSEGLPAVFVALLCTPHFARWPLAVDYWPHPQLPSFFRCAAHPSPSRAETIVQRDLYSKSPRRYIAKSGGFSEGGFGVVIRDGFWRARVKAALQLCEINSARLHAKKMNDPNYFDELEAEIYKMQQKVAKLININNERQRAAALHEIQCLRRHGTASTLLAAPCSSKSGIS